MNNIIMQAQSASVNVCWEQIKFVSIKHGDFFMPGKGCVVSLIKDYWLQEMAVTQQQCRAVCGESPLHFKGGELPVENVSWHESVLYQT